MLEIKQVYTRQDWDLLLQIGGELIISGFVILCLVLAVLLLAKHFPWRNAELAETRCKQENIIAQLESLKSQINPHFLFNNLNTLSSLIEYDKEMSKTFIDDLSTVYRYVLEHKDNAVLPVKVELNFIKAFIQLLKKRHGEQLVFHFNIAKEALSMGIPPMSLQL